MPITVWISLISPLNKGQTEAAFQAMGTSPERRDRLKRLEIGFGMIGAATLKKKVSKPSDPDVCFLGVTFQELL